MCLGGSNSGPCAFAGQTRRRRRPDTNTIGTNRAGKFLWLGVWIRLVSSSKHVATEGCPTLARRAASQLCAKLDSDALPSRAAQAKRGGVAALRARLNMLQVVDRVNGAPWRGARHPSFVALQDMLPDIKPRSRPECYARPRASPGVSTRTYPCGSALCSLGAALKMLRKPPRKFTLLE